MRKSISVTTVIKILLRKGFVFISQKGSHQKYRKETSKKLTVIVPVHKKDIPIGTFRSILRQSGLSQEDFENT